MRKLTQTDSSLYSLEKLVDEIICFAFPSTTFGYIPPTLCFRKLHLAESSQLIIPSSQWPSLSALGCQGEVVMPIQLTCVTAKPVPGTALAKNHRHCRKRTPRTHAGQEAGCSPSHSKGWLSWVADWDAS